MKPTIRPTRPALIDNAFREEGRNHEAAGSPITKCGSSFCFLCEPAVEMQVHGLADVPGDSCRRGGIHSELPPGLVRPPGFPDPVLGAGGSGFPGLQSLGGPDGETLLATVEALSSAF